MNNRSKGIDIFLFLFIIYSGLPIMSAYLSTTINVLVIVFMYVYAAYRLNKRFFSVVVLFSPLFAVDYLRCFGYAFEGGDDFIRDFYGILRKMLWPLFVAWIVKADNKLLARNALLLTLIVYSITAITTITGCHLFPNASRIITDTFQDEHMRYFLKSQNIGDFQFVYTIALALPIFIYYYKYNHLDIFLTALFVGLFAYTIYTAEFTIALMFSVFTLALFFAPKSYNVKRILIISFVGFIILISSKTFLIDLLQKVSEVIGSDTMGQRFADMSQSLSGGFVTDESDYALRTEAWQRSWNAFADNPLWGSFGKSGGHSLILDTIGNFGFIGLVALFLTFRSLYILYVRQYKKEDVFLFVSYIYLLNIVFCIFNTLIMYMVFTFVIPLTALCFAKRINVHR